MGDHGHVPEKLEPVGLGLELVRDLERPELVGLDPELDRDLEKLELEVLVSADLDRDPEKLVPLRALR